MVRSMCSTPGHCGKLEQRSKKLKQEKLETHLARAIWTPQISPNPPSASEVNQGETSAKQAVRKSRKPT